NERPYFPCQCTVNSCKNPFGFVEFNPDRVRSHQTSVFFRLNNFPDSFEVSTPKHVYLEDSRVRSTYLPLTPTTDDKSLSVEPLIDKKLKSGNDALGASHSKVLA
uniref:CSRNP_N domain-containing protein n=1 Tax=Syphacia muris TaxID=451379 RepID=A0A0N5AMN8_9BILA